MKNDLLIKRLKAGLKSDETGNKANSLLFLHRYGFNIPITYLVTSEAYLRYINEGPAVLQQLRKEIINLPEKVFAVRSSTSAEDSDEFSFAGQFQTLINVKGTDNIIGAIQKVWDSASLVSGNEYLERTGVRSLKCAVIIQEMIESVLAGVSFSRNPVTNQNEIVIEAVEGPGEELVQKGATPLRWRIRKDNVAEGNQLHHFYHIISQIASDTLRLKRYYGNHIDIEWVYDGRKLYYLQLRQITGRKDLQIYSNKMAREMLPGQIKPLVWSVNVPMVNGTWIGLLSEIAGPLDIKPEDLARSFYFQTYFNVVALGKLFSRFGMSADSLEYLMIRNDDARPSFKPGPRMLRHSFRIMRFIYDKINFEKRFLKEFPVLKDRYDEFEKLFDSEYSKVSAESYNRLFDLLFAEGKKLAYLNIVIPLLMSIHHKRLKKALTKKGIDYDLLDFRDDFPDLRTLNPMARMAIIKGKIDALPQSVRVRCTSLTELRSVWEAGHIADDFDAFIREFGHFSESGNDFSYPKWEEDPEKVFGMFMNTSQVPAGANLATLGEFQDRGVRIGSILRRKYEKAGRFKVYREQISSFYIYGYGLFRKLFLRLGEDLACRGVIEKPDDIFYLTKQELDGIAGYEYNTEAARWKDLVAERRGEMEVTRDVVLPPVIYGDEAPLLVTGRVKNHPGIGTSPGSFTGNTRVVRGISDFSDVEKSDVLLIPFSDVSWTPVLVKAGAIVSETGGMLSHCSIIAREMGIPALVSVANACGFGNGLKVTVDGSNGVLTIHDYE